MPSQALSNVGSFMKKVYFLHEWAVALLDGEETKARRTLCKGLDDAYR